MYLGGLVAIQVKCDYDEYGDYRQIMRKDGTFFWQYSSKIEGMDGVSGISNWLPCSKVFRYHWFIVSWQAVTMAGERTHEHPEKFYWGLPVPDCGLLIQLLSPSSSPSLAPPLSRPASD